MSRRIFLFKAATIAVLPLLASACAQGAFSTDSTREQTRQDIQTNFVATLERGNVVAPEVRNLIAQAKGVLVFPIVTGTNPLTGSKVGSGVLRVANAYTSYYLLTMDAKGQSLNNDSDALIILFMTFDALDRFRASDPWRPGDTMVAIPKIGIDGRFTLESSRADVIALIFERERLVAAPMPAGLVIESLDL